MTFLRWYAIGRTIYARRGPEAHGRDVIVALCASAAIAEHIAGEHNRSLIDDTTRKVSA